MHIDEAARLAALANLSRIELTPIDLRGALIEVTSALPELFQVDGAGILLVDDTQVLRCVCATDALAKALEVTQEDSGRGPCIDALVDGVIVTVDDLATEPRWPGLAESLAAAGVGGLLGVPVGLGGAAVGSLNVYTREPHVWDESDVAAISAFASLVGHLFVVALASDRRGELVGQLQHALDARVEIERAVGMLMVLGDDDATGAFEVLRRAARSARIPVRELARTVIQERRAPIVELET